MIPYTLLFKILAGVFVVLPIFYMSVDHIVQAKYTEVSVRVDGLERLESERAAFIKDGVIDVRSTCMSIEARLGRIEELLYSKLGDK